jgi:hypothetical protein
MCLVSVYFGERPSKFASDKAEIARISYRSPFLIGKEAPDSMVSSGLLSVIDRLGLLSRLADKEASLWLPPDE